MNYIPVKIPKATLYLTPDEFKRAIRRGKAITRAMTQKDRQDAARGMAEFKACEHVHGYVYHRQASRLDCPVEGKYG